MHADLKKVIASAKVAQALCPDFQHHTPCPVADSDYLGWHAWARKMSKTHRQVKCSGCGLYAIWIPKHRSDEE